MLRLEGITKIFGGLTALEDVSLGGQERLHNRRYRPERRRQNNII